MIRRLFRWAFRLFLLLIVLVAVAVVAGILLLDTMTREALVNRLRAKTGMEVKISAVHVGLLSPTISIEGLKLYNTPAYGGSVCLDMPELHIEYDPSALRSRQLHITLLRLEIRELSVLQDKSGRRNFDLTQKNVIVSTQGKSLPHRLKFAGIDVLNVTLGKFHRSNMVSGDGEDINFGVKNQILRNVKSNKDLAPLGLSNLSHGKASGTSDLDLNQLLNQLLDALLETP